MTRRQHRAVRRLSKLVEGRFGPVGWPSGTSVTGVSFTGEAGQPLRMSIDLVVEEPVMVQQRIGDTVRTHSFGPPCSEFNPDGCPDS